MESNKEGKTKEKDESLMVSKVHKVKTRVIPPIENIKQNTIFIQNNEFMKLNANPTDQYQKNNSTRT
jgi:hypothetical protein